MREKTQERSLAYVRKRDPEALYRFSEEGVMGKIDVLEEVVEGKTVQCYMDELKKAKVDLAALESRVGYFVRSAGAKMLEEVVIINPKKEYTIAHTGKNGIIEDVSPVSSEAAILEGTPIPEGIEYRYHKIENNKIVEDVLMKHSVYRLM